MSWKNILFYWLLADFETNLNKIFPLFFFYSHMLRRPIKFFNNRFAFDTLRPTSEFEFFFYVLNLKFFLVVSSLFQLKKQCRFYFGYRSQNDISIDSSASKLVNPPYRIVLFLRFPFLKAFTVTDHSPFYC